MKSLRVIIVDDEQDIRDALYGWLSKDFAVDCYESAELALKAITNPQFENDIPICILVDLNMPNTSGIELQSQLAALNTAHPIVFMSGSATQADIIKTWQGGAIDFILKPFSAEQISQALKKVLDKLHSLKTTSEAKIIDLQITRREAQVLLLLGKGFQQIEVADKLGLALRTVKMYRAFLKNKLNLNTQMELARYCDKHSKSIELIANLE